MGFLELLSVLRSKIPNADSNEICNWHWMRIAYCAWAVAHLAWLEKITSFTKLENH